MGTVVLINPNTNAATTTMMTDIARNWLSPRGLDVIGRTVASGPPIIIESSVLPAAAEQVVVTGIAARREIPDVAGMIVSAFADPGLGGLADAVDVPVTGIAGAGIREAAQGGRRFGIVSVAPALAAAVTGLVHAYGCTDGFTGLRTADISPEQIAADPNALVKAMVRLAERSVADDGAEVVVIGGGPLGAVTEAITARLDIPTVSPIIAACVEIATAVARAATSAPGVSRCRSR